MEQTSEKVNEKPKGRQSDFARLSHVKTIWPPKLYEYPTEQQNSKVGESDVKSDISR